MGGLVKWAIRELSLRPPACRAGALTLTGSNKNNEKPNSRGWFRVARDKSAGGEFRHRRIAVENDFLLMENFAGAIDTDGETILDAQAGRAICATVQAAIDSGRTGVPVDVG